MAWRKWIRTFLTWVGLAAEDETADLFEADGEETAVSSPHPLSPSSPPVAAKSVTAFNLRLLDAGPDRESVIHLLHEMSGMSLRQIRTLVDSAPVHVMQAIDAHTGRAIQKRLAALGATSELIDGQIDSVEPPTAEKRAVDKPVHPDNTFFLFGDYDVLLQSSGAQPSQVVQVLRDLLNGRNLAEVERKVANVPHKVVNQVPLETAKTIKIRLERAGAIVEIVTRKTT